jgi:membrane-associated phospholipid phosphatase
MFQIVKRVIANFGFKVFLLFIPVVISAQNIDINILRAVNSQKDLSSDKFFRFASNSDAYIIALVPTTMALDSFHKNDKSLFRNSCVIAASIAINYGTVNILKYSVNRKRPFVSYPDIYKKSSGESPSFPSGHTSGAFATATSLSLVYQRWYIVVPSFTWAGIVGYSRLHLGVHYPSDVLVGAIIGSGTAYLCYKVNKKLNKR